MRLRRNITKFLLKFIDLEYLTHKLNKEIEKKYIIGDSSKVHPESQIINMQHDPQKIIIGSNSHVRGHLQIFTQGGRIRIGDFCYIGEDSRIWSAGNIEIGNRVLIAHNVNIHDNISHPLDSKLRHEDYKRILGIGIYDARKFDLREKSITIMDDAWIGFNAIIFKGVTIGKGAIVGAGSCVLTNVPDYAVVVGNPAKIIKFTT